MGTFVVGINATTSGHFFRLFGREIGLVAAMAQLVSHRTESMAKLFVKDA